MANKDPKNVKRFVENVSKGVAEAAYEGGGSGVNELVDFPLHATIELDGKKLLDCFIANGVDVDDKYAYDSTNYIFGMIYEAMLSEDVPPQDVDLTIEAGESNAAYPFLCAEQGPQFEAPENSTIRNVLTAMSKPTFTNNVVDCKILPVIIIKTPDVETYTFIEISAKEFLEICTITPASNE